MQSLQMEISTLPPNKLGISLAGVKNIFNTNLYWIVSENYFLFIEILSRSFCPNICSQEIGRTKPCQQEYVDLIVSSSHNGIKAVKRK